MPANEVMVRVDSIAQSEWEGMRQAGASQKLPNAKASDSGKVVSVNSSGKYVLASGGGGAEKITATLDTQSESVSLSATYKQIHDGISAGTTYYIEQEYVDGYSIPYSLSIVTYVSETVSGEGNDQHTSYYVYAGDGGTYMAADENDYPSYGIG